MKTRIWRKTKNNNTEPLIYAIQCDDMKFVSERIFTYLDEEWNGSNSYNIKYTVSKSCVDSELGKVHIIAFAIIKFDDKAYAPSDVMFAKFFEHRCRKMNLLNK